jgi:hypothetical protein
MTSRQHGVNLIHRKFTTGCHKTISSTRTYRHRAPEMRTAVCASNQLYRLIRDSSSKCIRLYPLCTASAALQHPNSDLPGEDFSFDGICRTEFFVDALYIATASARRFLLNVSQRDIVEEKNRSLTVPSTKSRISSPHLLLIRKRSMNRYTPSEASNKKVIP